MKKIISKSLENLTMNGQTKNRAIAKIKYMHKNKEKPNELITAYLDCADAKIYDRKLDEDYKCHPVIKDRHTPGYLRWDVHDDDDTVTIIVTYYRNNRTGCERDGEYYVYYNNDIAAAISSLNGKVVDCTRHRQSVLSPVMDLLDGSDSDQNEMDGDDVI